MATQFEIPFIGTVLKTRKLELDDGTVLIGFLCDDAADADREPIEFFIKKSRCFEDFDRVPEKGETLGVVLRISVRTRRDGAPTNSLKFQYVGGLPTGIVGLVPAAAVGADAPDYE